MTPQQIFELITDVTQSSIFVEFCDLEDDECDLIKTHETIDDWIASRANWAERGEADVDVHNGTPYAYFEGVQVAKGQQRKDICVIDCGDYRLVHNC
tara:strand:- start:376 stop:666 length:291 start_codon:yes stop_codon:yes gene_type:complete